jgi:hypothetical protein
MKTVLQRFIISPFKRILTNPSIVILVAVVVMLDNFRTNPKLQILDFGFENPLQWLDGTFVYEKLPMLLGDALRLYQIIIILFALSLLQFLLAVVIMTDLRLIYQNRRVGLIDSLYQIKFKDIGWYYVWLVSLYGTLVLIFTLAYISGFLLWKYFQINISFALIIFSILIFPGYYAMLSVGAKIAVIPISWKDRMRYMYRLGTWENIRKIYIFYPIRLLVEFFCLFMVPFLILQIVDNRLMAIGIGSIALLLPLSAFRASTFEFFLDIYKDDPQIREFFSEYYST